MFQAKLVGVKEGCNLFGFLEVNKVAGNFHIAPGKVRNGLLTLTPTRHKG